MLEIFDLKNALGEAKGTRVVFGVPVVTSPSSQFTKKRGV